MENSPKTPSPAESEPWKPDPMWKPGVISYEEDFITLEGDMTYAEIKALEHAARVEYMKPEYDADRQAVLDALVPKDAEVHFEAGAEARWERDWGKVH